VEVEEADESDIAVARDALPPAVAPGEARSANAPWFARRRVLLVGALYLLIVLVELAAPIVRGQWYTAADTGQGYAVTALKSYSAPVKNVIQGDVYTQADPLLKLDVQSIRSGHLPLWNADNGNGQPLLADSISAPFSLFTLPFYILPFAVALVVSAGLKLWCLAFFTFLWLRRLLRRDLAAVLGGLLFAFAGYQIIWLNWQVQVASAVPIPFALWCIQVALDWLPRRTSREEAIKRRRVLGLCVVGGAVALAASILGGHPETVIYGSIVVAIYCVAAGIYRLGLSSRFIKWVLSAAAAGVVGIALSAVVVLPFLQYEQNSSRIANGRLAATSAASPVSLTPMMAYPNLFGSPSAEYSDTAFDSQYNTNYAETNDSFVGLVALCLAPLGIAGLFVRRTRFVATVGVVLAALGAFLLDTGIGYKIWNRLPVLGSANVDRSEDILILGVVTSAVVGVDWLLVGPQRGRFSDWRFRAATALATGGAVAVLFTVGARSLRRRVERAGGGAATASASHYARGQIEIQVLFAALALGLLCLLIPMARRRWKAIAISTAVVATTAASVMLPLSTWNPTVPGSVAYPETPELSALKKVVGSTLSLYPGALPPAYTPGAFPPPMTNAWYGLEDVGTYDTLGVAWRDDVYDKAFGFVPSPSDNSITRFEQMPVCMDELRLFGIQHVVGGTGFFSQSSIHLVGHEISGPYPFNYYDVPDSGLVSLIGKSANVAGDATAMSEVTKCSFDANREVVISPDRFDANATSPMPSMTGSQLSAASAKVVERSSTSVTVDTKAKAGGWLVIRQTWYPGWQAQVDGHQAAVRRADVAFQAVRVPAGAHVVTLRFVPKTVSTGVKVSAAAVVLIVLIVLWTVTDWPATAWRKLRRRPGPGGDHRFHHWLGERDSHRS
jgi:hypothetical protein